MCAAGRYAARVSDGAEHRIRNVAVGLVVRDGHVLAEEYPAGPGRHRFVRAIGGGIEFGERAADAVVREFREELDVEVTARRLLAVTENLFELAGAPGHEVVHIFEVRCPQLDALPLGGRIKVRDNGTWVSWFPLADLAAQEPPFYPDGVIALAASLDGPEGAAGSAGRVHSSV